MKAKETAKRLAAERAAKAIAAGGGRRHGGHKVIPTAGENTLNPNIDLDDIARNALKRIDRKLEGLFVCYRDREMQKAMKSAPEKEVPTNSLVDMLIREATNVEHLVSRICDLT